MKDGVSYACAGYTLERRNGAAWGPAQLFTGTAYASADTNACVRLTWQWRATGGAAGTDLDPLFDDYVTDGLLLHVDGIRNAGADKPHDNAASAWVDLVAGKFAPFHHDADDGSAWREDGYYFGGTSYAQFTAQLAGLTNTVTVQVSRTPAAATSISRRTPGSDTTRRPSAPARRTTSRRERPSPAP